MAGGVPQLRGVLPTLTARGSLETGRCLFPRAKVRSRHGHAAALYPLLVPQMCAVGGQLSGRGRKVLALGRALMAGPMVLSLGGPCEGLSPSMADQVLRAHEAALARRGVGVLLIGQRAIEAGTIVSSLPDRTITISMPQLNSS